MSVVVEFQYTVNSNVTASIAGHAESTQLKNMADMIHTGMDSMKKGMFSFVKLLFN